MRLASQALLLSAALSLALSVHVASADTPPAGVGALIDAQTMQSVRHDPELRTLLGLSGDGIDLSGQLTDVSLPRRAELRAQMQGNLDALERIDASRLTGQDRWSHGLAVWFYQRQIELMQPDWAPAWLPVGASTYAVDQLFSVPVQLPAFLENQHAVRDEASARAYISRLHAVATKIDQVRANFDLQARHGVLPPQVAMEGAASQIRALTQPDPASSPLVQSFRRKLDKVGAFTAQQREALLAQAARAVREDANPAYARLLARLDEEIARKPGSRGMWALPGGDAYYDAALRWNTSTDLGADAIHRIGVDEVARIEKAMDALLVAQDRRTGSVGERMSALVKDPRFQYADTDAGRAELVGDIKRTLAALTPHIPDYFGRTPPQPLDVRPVPKESQATAPGAYYVQPAMDGSRPGIYFINLGNLEANTRWSLPTLTYHEGSPGHHFQIAIGQTLTDLPMLRRSLNPSAFSEGWALYAEQLASEMGLYRDDPWGDLGRLRAELFRSVRLVVDTGLHRKRWTPEQAIAYMHEHTGMPLDEVRIEVYRYLVQPGQACSYKIGHLKFVELRERARTALGERFDIRAFHDLVLGNGAMPLAVLEASVDDWIRTQRGTVAKAR
ncbi:DUF885 domain-containing protein [Lysobacter sp. MMG2]|uniref:DUF885 domain-containing protein n=1 Tax=Lysobacter sp. MMG2 TaxID=2801338 RepID=UPI001C22DE44|nr:DUF885 domain-containing protein [Lysobacter sp. MMG2]MBU8976013.1 DUF885 domain-containing protein [Lysobacter sp. MMG2]